MCDSINCRKAEAILADRPSFVELLGQVMELKNFTGRTYLECVETVDNLYYFPSDEEVSQAVAKTYNKSMRYSWGEVRRAANLIVRYNVQRVRRRSGNRG